MARQRWPRNSAANALRTFQTLKNVCEVRGDGAWALTPTLDFVFDLLFFAEILSCTAFCITTNSYAALTFTWIPAHFSSSMSVAA